MLLLGAVSRYLYTLDNLATHNQTKEDVSFKFLTMLSSKHERAWLLTPNQDYTATGVLQVGQILTDYMDPNSTVLHSGTNTIPEKTSLDQSTHGEADYT
jgi:hypothetical protein